MSLSKITNHKEQMLARLLYQYKNKPYITKVITVIAARYQGLEDAFWQLASERWIETGVGVQLDVIGKILQQERGDSANDAAYRIRLKARMRANQSSGTVEDILAVFLVLLGSVAEVHLEQLFPAALVLHLFSEDGISDATAALYAEFLESSRAAAIDAQFHYSSAPFAETFACPPSTRTTATYLFASQTSIKVTSTEGFPASGTIVFQQGDDANQMEVTYTSRTAASFEGCVVQWGVPANQSSGSLVCGITERHSFLRDDFEGSPFPAQLELYDNSVFPSSGYFVLNYGKSNRRVFSYTDKNDVNELTGIGETDEGTETVFAADSPIVFVDKGFSSTEVTIMGGYLSTILEA